MGLLARCDDCLFGGYQRSFLVFRSVDPAPLPQPFGVAFSTNVIKATISFPGCGHAVMNAGSTIQRFPKGRCPLGSMCPFE